MSPGKHRETHDAKPLAGIHRFPPRKHFNAARSKWPGWVRAQLFPTSLLHWPHQSPPAASGPSCCPPETQGLLGSVPASPHPDRVSSRAPLTRFDLSASPYASGALLAWPPRPNDGSRFASGLPDSWPGASRAVDRAPIVRPCLSPASRPSAASTDPLTQVVRPCRICCSFPSIVSRRHPQGSQYPRPLGNYFFF